MTVNVDTNLVLPQDTDNYNLIADLNVFKGSIVNSLNDVITELGQRPETGSNAAFNSVTCTAGGVFGGSVGIVSSDTGSNLVIDNSSAGYGFTKGATSFRFNGSKFVSSAPIQIVDGGGGQDAVSQNYVATQMAIAAGWDAAVLAQVVALDERSVTRYNGLQTWAPNANYANTAGYAASAGSAPVSAHNHDGTYQPAGSYAPAANRPAIYTGLRDDIASVPARGTRDFTLALPIVGVYPSYLGLTVIDINGDEVFAQVRSGWGTPNSVPVRLRNVSSSGETVRVMWMAVY